MLAVQKALKMNAKKSEKLYGWRREMLSRIWKEQSIRKNLERKGDRDKGANIINISKAIDIYHTTEQLELYCTQLLYDTFVITTTGEHSSSIYEIDYVIRKAKKLKEDNFYIKIYYNLYLLIKNVQKTTMEAEENYDLVQVEKLLAVYGEHIHYLDLVTIYTKIMNYCAKKINSDLYSYRIKYIEYSLKIIRLMFSKIRRPIGEIGFAHFQNTVKLILSCMVIYPSKSYSISIEDIKVPKINITQDTNPTDWVRRFVEEYKWRLPKLKKESKKEYKLKRKRYLHYVLAINSFVDKNFEEAFSLVCDRETHKETFIGFENRILFLQILYELENHHPAFLEAQNVNLYKETESFRQSIQRRVEGKRSYQKKNKVMKYQLQYFNFFLDSFQKLITINKNFYGIYSLKSNKAFNKLKSELLQRLEGRHFIFVPWFRDKLIEIENG